MEFSIVIPAYNEEKYIKRCINAINKLNYPKNKYEIIVVNNNSTDKTESVIKTYKNLQLLNEARQGINYARQKGLNKAKGKYYISIDADTILPKNYLLIAKKLIKLNPHFSCIYGPVMPYDYKYKFISKIIFIATIFLGLTIKHIYNCNAIYNTEKLRYIDGFTNIPDSHKNYDDGVLSVLLAKNKILFAKELVAYISIRRYVGLRFFSIFKNLYYYYKFYFTFKYKF